MKNRIQTPNRLTFSNTCVEWYPGPSSFYVEAFRDGECVLAVTWSLDGDGQPIVDELDDAESDAVFAEVRKAYLATP